MSETPEETTETTDVFEMSTEQFEESKAALLAGEPPVETTEEEPVDETPVDDTTTLETNEEQEPEMVTLIHKGKEVQVTKEEERRLAQMGFDYTDKTKRIAKHRKLVDLVEADEELRNKINEHIEGLSKPKLKPMDEFETEEEWLEENLKLARKASTQAPASPPENVQTAFDMLAARDPEHYDQVITAFTKHAGSLSVDETNKINSGDQEALISFYDDVKAKELGTAPAPKDTVFAKKAAAPFRVKSSGGVAPRQPQGPKSAWDLPAKDFNKLLRKAKGY